MNHKSLIESLLFVSPKPLSLKELVDFLKEDKAKIEEVLNQLVEEYNHSEKGIKIIENDKKYQMASSSENAKAVRDFLQSEVSGELTPASLETLTIIAYRGPVRKSDLEKIRGINCSLIIRNLLIRGLIEEKSDKDEEDKEYSVSLDFVKFLGINSVKDLPDYEKFHNNPDIDRMLGRIGFSEGDTGDLEISINNSEATDNIDLDNKEEDKGEFEDDNENEDEDEDDDEDEDEDKVSSN